MSEPIAKRIEHISIAVRDAEGAKRAYRALGFEPMWIEDLVGQSLRSHVIGTGQVMIELIESLPGADEPTTVDRFLEQRGEGVHHVCLEVTSLDDARKAVDTAGLKLVDPTPTVDDRGQRVFVHPSSSHGVLIGLVELHQPERTPPSAGDSGRQVYGLGHAEFEGKTFVPAVRRHGDALFVSGLNAVGDDGSVDADDVVGQARCIFRKLEGILTEAGATFDNVVKTTDYLLSKDGYRGVADVRREFFDSTYPAATGVVVKELFGAGVLIEMDVIAVV